jgi:hypothetical protein
MGVAACWTCACLRKAAAMSKRSVLLGIPERYIWAATETCVSAVLHSEGSYETVKWEYAHRAEICHRHAG